MSRIVQIIPAHDWVAMMSYSDGNDLASLVAWALTDTGEVVGLVATPMGVVRADTLPIFRRYSPGGVR